MRQLKNRLRNWWNASAFPVSDHGQLPGSQIWTTRQNVLALGCLLIASMVVLLPNLSYPLIDPDETRYAQIALEMIESRDWVTPMLDGRAYLDKPPMMYWMTAISFNVLGHNESAARLPSVLSALATIMMLFVLGRRFVGSRAAFLGAVSLLLCGGFLLAGRFLILDSMLTLFTTISLLTGYIAVREQKHRWVWWMISGVACALGVLTKGPVALVLCAPPLAVNGWLRKDQTRTRRLHWIAFVLPMTLVCVPWYIAIWKFNPEFGDYFFLEHNFKRFTEGSNHRQPFWFYLPILFVAMFPTSLLLPSLAVFLASRSERKRNARSKDLGFLFCGSVWVLAFFSIASCKLPTYILPAIPLVALMMGAMLDHTVFKPDLPSRITSYLKPFPQRASMVMFVMSMTIAAVDVWLTGSLQFTVAMAMMVSVTLAMITVANWNHQIAFEMPGWAFLSLVGITLLSFAGERLMPTIAAYRSIHTKVAIAAEQHPGATIVYFGENPHALELVMPTSNVFYFCREQREAFVAFLSHYPEVLLVTDDEEIESTRQAVATTHQLVQTRLDKHLYVASRQHPTRDL
ncbi:phospholipid carrier-dependent glycosyltransferase [Novipirellula artificiosorum]|uniref:Undecaprenyl phosphate-alpha-4-amino-4-deoxy-L-arabinose arabinosyl transferase n=1 Tax=Novipirellula artificiosorum TaxID=2528016 RepID=A0A5C6DFQ8_9BACT|nr:phospholipid carrier-dependent glycosyltransferase [Novipirellula artificiosorum]TWU35015.1 Undecaprenyl phosphate-alpha-4-amino-4-deoxy-L-arabinose arabinosyl transferase [Novipirellula artificiosorum]